MSQSDKTRQQLLDELQELTSRMMEAEETLRRYTKRRGGWTGCLNSGGRSGLYTNGCQHPYRVMVENHE